MKRIEKLIKVVILILLPICSNGQVKEMYIKSDIYPISIEVMRHRDPFNRESIEKLVIDKPMSFSLNLEEIDTYMLTQKDNNRFLVFIWDEDIEIHLKADSLDKSEVLMSPLNKEFDNYEVLAEKIVFSRLRKLETHISTMYDEKKNKNPDSLKVIQKLKIERDSLMNTLGESYIQFVRQYLKDHPKSFIAIYMLHFMEITPTEADKKILREMPEEYKNNYRYKGLMERN